MNTYNTYRKGNMHPKFEKQNLYLKCNYILVHKLMDFINKKIKEIYNNNIGKGLLRKCLFRMNKTIYFNRNLLTKTLLEIFSEDISTRITNYPRDYNKKLIEELLNEKDDDKRYYFQNLFNLHFLDCLEHFTNKRVIEELQGLKTFLEIKNDENELKRLRLDDKEYLETIEYHLNHYEEILNKKREE